MSFRFQVRVVTVVAFIWLASLPAQADLITEKRSYSIQNFATSGGELIPELRLGYETYGRLNADKTNAILITHYFSGNSHAAGKYRAEDAKPGYWDALIGPGKAIDTERYFVVAADTPVNLGAYDANVITTGPASVNPATGKIWGVTFPLLEVGDFVAAQKALMDQLGITKLHAIAGASGGAIQAMQWAADYPGFAGRYLLVIGPGTRLDARAVAELETWMQPILLDPAWKNGAYAHSSTPLQGLVLSLRNITLAALDTPWLEQEFGRQWSDAQKPPLQSLVNNFKVNDGLLAMARARAEQVDANHLLYMARAYQQFDVGDKVAAMRGQFLFVPAKGDRIFEPALSTQAAAQLIQRGMKAQVLEIDGGMGHLDGIFYITQVETQIKRFVDQGL